MTQEVKKMGYIAGPMVAVNLSQYFLQVLSIMMFGLSAALETLCGQAYGAKQYQQLGIHIQTGVFSLIVACIPLSVLWIFMEKLLAAVGQDPAIPQEAGKFTICLIPALFAYATLQALVRYFQMQSLVAPLIVSSIMTLCFHVFACWILVYKFVFGKLGAAFAIGSSYWLNVIILGAYMIFSSDCEKTRVRISMELFNGIGKFFRLALPSATMICLEW